VSTTNYFFIEAQSVAQSCIISLHSTGEALMLAIDKIKIEGTQSRVQINESTVSEYAEAIQNGAQFPPVTVFFDGTNFWLADGFHRLLAHKRAGKPEILETREAGTIYTWMHPLRSRRERRIPRYSLY